MSCMYVYTYVRSCRHVRISGIDWPLDLARIFVASSSELRDGVPEQCSLSAQLYSNPLSLSVPPSVCEVGKWCGTTCGD